ncbi:hypothetical protein PR202_ga28606 [Eleusine coracana subsp. coracana]|uniref:DUF4220 domain-containing protein n=1 Tax=Eleusine coracana subsp. coracana TaxID=191504 RepID=A0AAV5DJN2_ELECO|nr:hypothetical protein PR202_ga28606 [Eleusine coracana subsp. coracana]
MELWKSARATVIRIEMLVVLIAISQLFMATFGSWRRRSRNLFIQYGVSCAHTLSSSLLLYTLGSMHSSEVKSSMYPIWAISLYILLGCVDSITAYNLNDNNQHTSQIFLFLLYHTYVTLITRSDDSVLAIYLPVIASFKFMQKFNAHRVASTSWNLNKMVADYMYEEHKKNGSSYDPASMKGYQAKTNSFSNMEGV